MGEEFSGTAPIYHQIVQRICKQIVRNDIRPGDKLPSVRDLALQFGVNPNTVQRVYMELERLGVAEARRGQGTFVSEDSDRLQQLREQLKQDQIKTFVQEMNEMGFNTEELQRGLVEFLSKWCKEGGTKR